MAADIEIRAAHARYIDHVALHLCAADRDEVALQGYDPSDALHASVDCSREAYAVLIDGEPAGIFGLAATPDGASPWLLTTDRFAMSSIGVARRARRIVRMWAQSSRLSNTCDARNGAALAFLRWLGFTVDDPAGRVMVSFSMPKGGV